MALSGGMPTVWMCETSSFSCGAEYSKVVGNFLYYNLKLIPNKVTKMLVANNFFGVGFTLLAPLPLPRGMPLSTIHTIK